MLFGGYSSTLVDKKRNPLWAGMSKVSIWETEKDGKLGGGEWDEERNSESCEERKGLGKIGMNEYEKLAKMRWRNGGKWEEVAGKQDKNSLIILTSFKTFAPSSKLTASAVHYFHIPDHVFPLQAQLPKRAPPTGPRVTNPIAQNLWITQ